MRYQAIVLSAFLAVAALIATPRTPALAAAPLVSSVTPSTGPIAGGTALTIYGSGFVSGAYVAIGGVLSSSVTVVNANQIAAVTPAGVAGAAQVVVINPDGQSATATGFTYSSTGATGAAGTSSSPDGSLWIAGINPPNGAAVGGQLVSITGFGFSPSVVITFGGVPVSSTTWMRDGYVLTYAPPGVGVVEIVMTNPNGQAAIAPTRFTYTGTAAGISTGALSITSVSPANAAPGTTLSIAGTGFLTGATVNVGGFYATNVVVNSPIQITATAPAGPTGNVVVLVTNLGGGVATRPGLVYDGTATTTTTATNTGQPNVTSVAPSTGSSAGGTLVTITGSGFASPAAVTFGGVPATSINVVSSGLITAVAPANPVGTAAVVISVPSGALAGLTAGFTYELAWPRVTSVSPSTGALGGGTTLTINGSGFAPGASITVGGQPAATVNAVSPTQIVVTTPPGPSGGATVLVTNPGGTISGLASAFSYSANPQPQPQAPPPRTDLGISVVAPSTGPSAGGTAVMIYGSGFQTGATVTISGVPVAANVLSSTQISATTPAVAGTGNVTVVVTNPGGGSFALPSAFTYTASSSSVTSTGATATPNNPLPAGGGLFVFSGGSNADLITASGCRATTAVFWTTDPTGGWVGYIPSVPVAVVNAAWTSLFPNGVPAGTPIVARC